PDRMPSHAAYYCDSASGHLTVEISMHLVGISSPTGFLNLSRRCSMGCASSGLPAVRLTSSTAASCETVCCSIVARLDLRKNPSLPNLAFNQSSSLLRRHTLV